MRSSERLGNEIEIEMKGNQGYHYEVKMKHIDLLFWVVGEESDCCRWAGITCDNITRHVHRIHLPGLDGHCKDYYNSDKEREEASKQRLRGNLSSSLLYLKQLRHLDLSCNDFSMSRVPNFIGSLGNL
ncbi:leucine-rich repeat protein, partial [Tanacetum coccineum]